MKKFITIGCLLFIITSIYAQTPPPGLNDGDDFKNWVRANFYTDIHTELGYSEARDKMYAYAENFNDSVECIYSGLKYRNPRGNEVGQLPPLNTEHSVPQSLYDENEPMRSDMHILFPCYDNWNSLRSNYPYGEIDDSDTEEWILGTTSTSEIPDTNIDAYSEYFNFFSERFWEPREIRKGDIARAVFYFFTMYPAYDIRFVGDVETFCDWHKEDLPDDREIFRNSEIIRFQKNTNPFIDNPEWANNAWGCDLPTNIFDLQIQASDWDIFPNPASELLKISLKDWTDFPLQLDFVALDGKTIYKSVVRNNNETIDISGFSNALYIATIRTESGDLLGSKRLIIE